MRCRPGCGACCIAPSISSPIPGMPAGKPAGEHCVQLTGDNHCALFDTGARPRICVDFRPSPDCCGNDARAALQLLQSLEEATAPTPPNRRC
jgi:hypothetical protein